MIAYHEYESSNRAVVKPSKSWGWRVAWTLLVIAAAIGAFELVWSCTHATS